MKILFTILFLFSFTAKSQDEPKLTRILFILDASNSMNTRWGKQTRIDAAKELLVKSITGLEGVPNLEIGLRIYGHQSPITATYQDCNDTKLEVPFGPQNISRIKSRIRSVQAMGTTPIARSLEAAAGDFPDATSRNVIILITDGLEACDNDPCVIAKKLKDKGVNVTPFVIGLGMDLSYLEKFKCIGEYAEAETKNAFENVLQRVINKALLNTTVQINLNDTNGKPTETDVNMFLYEAGTTKLLYEFVHTFNEAGNPDTLVIDPDKKYDITVFTTPTVELKNVSILRNQHNTIQIDAPQGFIKVRFLNANKPYQVECRIMKAGEYKTLNTQKVNSLDKYLVGNYTVEILTLPRIYISANVEQSNINTINIKAPGHFKYSSSSPIIGQIFIMNSEDKWEWVCNLSDLKKSKATRLQPGEYKLVTRKKNLKSSTFTTTNIFRINSNTTVTLAL